MVLVRVILACRPNHFSLGRVEQAMLSVHLKEVRALPHITAVHRIGFHESGCMALNQGMQILPMAQILGPVQKHPTALAANARSNAEVPAIRFAPRAWVSEAR